MSRKIAYALAILLFGVAAVIHFRSEYKDNKPAREGPEIHKRVLREVAEMRKEKKKTSNLVHRTLDLKMIRINWSVFLRSRTMIYQRLTLLRSWISLRIVFVLPKVVIVGQETRLRDYFGLCHLAPRNPRFRRFAPLPWPHGQKSLAGKSTPKWRSSRRSLSDFARGSALPEYSDERFRLRRPAAGSRKSLYPQLSIPRPHLRQHRLDLRGRARRHELLSAADDLRLSHRLQGLWAYPLRLSSDQPGFTHRRRLARLCRCGTPFRRPPAFAGRRGPFRPAPHTHRIRRLDRGHYGFGAERLFSADLSALFAPRGIGIEGRAAPGSPTFPS